LKKKNLVAKEGNRLAYTCLDGTIIKLFRKAWDSNENGCLDRVMDEFEQKTTKLKPDTSEDNDSSPSSDDDSK